MAVNSVKQQSSGISPANSWEFSNESFGGNSRDFKAEVRVISRREISVAFFLVH